MTIGHIISVQRMSTLTATAADGPM